MHCPILKLEVVKFCYTGELESFTHLYWIIIGWYLKLKLLNKIAKNKAKQPRGHLQVSCGWAIIVWQARKME